MEVAESQTLKVPPGIKIQVSTKKHFKIVDRGNRLLLIGIKPGIGLIQAGKISYQIQVLPQGQIDFRRHLEKHFKKRMGLKIGNDPLLVRVQGELFVFEDWLELSQISKEHQSTYSFEATPTTDALNEAQKYFSQKISDLHLGAFQLSSTFPLKAFIKASKEDFKRASDFFSSFGIQVEKSKRVLELEPLVKTSVILAEVSRKASSSLGIQFPTQVEGQLLPKLAGPANLMTSLNALESRGLGKVLASPNLSCRSGASAEFHAGGEFPIRLSGYARQSVQWKKHGVVLKVEPKADSRGAIRISVETEVSLIDAGQMVDGLPAMKTNRVKSHFDLKGKTTIAMSGLIQETWGRSRSGLFGLSQIPVLGALFGSEDFLNNQSELVIFVTPEVVSYSLNSKIQWPKEWTREEI
tara:strand:- start:640 stop:1869 length:1230 start_codon:yes stop_codon:yes gene_type:complete